MKNIEKLTELQHKVGYEKGEVNLIALLGLAGESGEALNETFITNEFILFKVRGFINEAKGLDTVKKEIRDKKFYSGQALLDAPGAEAFDKELADVFYYLHALCINRGLTIEDLAKLSYEKVLRKSQIDITHGSVNKETLIS